MEFADDMLYLWNLDSMDVDQKKKRKSCKRKNLYLPGLWAYLEKMVIKKPCKIARLDDLDI